MREHLTRNDALDGLRAFAVANVIFGHLLLPLGSNAGVTVFFVISGYLITGLLLRECDSTGSIRIANFYRRRFARLGPGLLLAVVAYSVWLLATAVPVQRWWTGLVGTLTYSYDLVFAFGSGRGSVFTWSWSLGIEEQFYLVWPVFILLLLRWRHGRRTLAVTCALLIIGAWLIRWHLTTSHPTNGRLSYSFDVHMDSIAWGALLALVAASYEFTHFRQVVAQLLLPALLVVFIGLKLVGIAPLDLSFDAAGFGATAVVATVLVAGLVWAPHGLLGSVLSWRPFVYLGWLSYGLYLWNFLIVLVVGRAVGHPPRFGVAVTAGTLVLCVAVAAASYHFVEQPLRVRWAKPRPAAIVADRDDSLTGSGRVDL